MDHIQQTAVLEREVKNLEQARAQAEVDLQNLDDAVASYGSGSNMVDDGISFMQLQDLRKEQALARKRVLDSVEEASALKDEIISTSRAVIARQRKVIAR